MKNILRALGAPLVTIALAAGTVSANAADKVTLGVAIPTATHGFTGGIVWWANEAKKELEKYGFYWERYKNNENASKHAKNIRTDIMKEEKDVAIHLKLSLTQLEFLEKACDTLNACKTLLKWSLAYGYFLEDQLQSNM